ncbi:hypothetical protein HUU05_20215 [candidate division KSB1 bacterium]|nr:hypothetical protein [candidate division KSB1 bacterium]
MAQTFSKYAGIIQTVVGLLGLVPGNLGGMLNTGQGSDIFNTIAGLALSYFGFKGSESQQRTGAQTVGGLSAIMGLLGGLGVNSTGAFALSEGWSLPNIINLLIGAWGLYSGFIAKKPAGATAH